MPRRHAAHGLLIGDKPTNQIEVERLHQLLMRNIDETRMRPQNAGVVEEGIDRPKLRVHRCKQIAHLLRIANVGLDRHRAPASLSHIRNHALGRRYIARIVDRHVISAPPCQPRRRRSNPARAPGDEQNFLHAHPGTTRLSSAGWRDPCRPLPTAMPCHPACKAQ
jgi:hypothetical protein